MLSDTALIIVKLMFVEKKNLKKKRSNNDFLYYVHKKYLTIFFSSSHITVILLFAVPTQASMHIWKEKNNNFVTEGNSYLISTATVVGARVEQ